MILRVFSSLVWRDGGPPGPPPPGITPADIVYRLRFVKYFATASMAFQTLDWLTSFGDEVELIWRSKWRLSKIMYLLARYSPFINFPLLFKYYHGHTPSLDTCRALYIGVTVIGTFSIVVSEVVLLMRTYAIYSCSKTMLFFLLALAISLVGTAFPILVIYLRSVEFVTGPEGCHLLSGSSLFLFVFVVLLLFELVIVVLTLYSGFKHFRHSPNPMVTTLYRDGLIYFLFTLLVTVANITIMALLPIDYVSLLPPLQINLHCVLATRIIIHVRKSIVNGESSIDIGAGFSTGPRSTTYEHTTHTLQMLDSIPRRVPTPTRRRRRRRPGYGVRDDELGEGEDGEDGLHGRRLEASTSRLDDAEPALK